MFIGKFEYPPYWIHYTYKSFFTEKLVDSYVIENKVYSMRDGGKLKVTLFETLHIDSRGHFTGLRCAIIVMLDKIMYKLKIGKPLAELCEFFASYPTW